MSSIGNNMVKPWVKIPTVINLNLFSPQRPLYLFLLIYRWASLLLAMWLFLFSTDVIVPGFSLSFLLAISLGGTLIITILHIPLKLKLFEAPHFLIVDIFLSILLLTFSGGSRSPYTLYALSPLLTGALFFQGRGALLALLSFSLFYPLTLFVSGFFFPSISVEPGPLLTQLAQAWLVTFLFASLSIILNQLRQAHRSLTEAHQNLTRRNRELSDTYHQLEVIHELTLFLHAPDRQSVQQQLLKAVTKEFEFPRAVVGLVNPGRNRLDRWQVYPQFRNQSLASPPLSLSEADNPIVQSALQQQVVWVAEGEGLRASEALNSWLNSGNWLILPMVWQMQTVGVLLMSVEQMGEVEPTDERWPILTSLVSQAAVALGTIDKTRRLAVEEERNRIARDIHDTVAQSLFGIVFTLDACTKLLPNHVDTVMAELVELRQVADKVRQQVRRSVLDLWPSVLTREQFKLDLDKYVKQCAVSAENFVVEYSIDGDFDDLSPVLRRSLYRVCQEALSNAARYAGVNSARVYLYVEPEEVNLSIRDKGAGFDPKPALAREHNREKFGLRGMKERIESLGGTCDILSQVGYGTQVLVRVPTHGSNGHGQ